MAINPLMTFKLVKELKKRPGRIAACGYPDIIAPEQIIADLTKDYLRPLQYRVDSDSICLRHGIEPSRRIPDAESFFDLFASKLDVFDIVRERGSEILCDLNYQLDDKHWEQYDYVIDVGTLEHCFNIAQAAMNMARLLKVGGLIFHENPQSGWSNHGFYSLQPTWYADFYGQPGWKLHDCRLLFRNGTHAVLEGKDRVRRFILQAEDANSYAVAERTEILPLTYPTQTKYKGAACE